MKKKLIETLLMASIAVCITACGASGKSASEDVAATASSTDTEETKELDYSNSFIVYDVIDSNTYGIEGVDFIGISKDVVTIEDATVVNGKGIPIGYIPAGTTITLTGRGPYTGVGSGIRQFANPVEGDESNYLYVFSSSLDEGEEELSSENDESKYEYSDEEKEANPMFSFSIFVDVMQDCGIEYNLLNQDLYDVRYTAEDFPDGEHSDLISFRKYDTSVDIPNENTVEWTKEKAEMFKAAGVTAFYAEGYSWGDSYSNIALWLFVDETRALTTLETEEFFQSEVDLQIDAEKEAKYQEWLNSQSNN